MSNVSTPNGSRGSPKPIHSPADMPMGLLRNSVPSGLPGPSGFAKFRSSGPPASLDSIQVNIMLPNKPAPQGVSKPFASPAFKSSGRSYASTNITGNHNTNASATACSSGNFKSQRDLQERPSTSHPPPKHYPYKARVVSVTKDNAFALAGELYGLKDKSYINPELIRVAS